MEFQVGDMVRGKYSHKMATVVGVEPRGIRVIYHGAPDGDYDGSGLVREVDEYVFIKRPKAEPAEPPAYGGNELGFPIMPATCTVCERSCHDHMVKTPGGTVVCKSCGEGWGDEIAADPFNGIREGDVVTWLDFAGTQKALVTECETVPPGKGVAAGHYLHTRRRLAGRNTHSFLSPGVCTVAIKREDL